MRGLKLFYWQVKIWTTFWKKNRNLLSYFGESNFSSRGNNIDDQQNVKEYNMSRETQVRGNTGQYDMEQQG